MKQPILVLGANGFIGREVVRGLASTDWAIPIKRRSRGNYRCQGSLEERSVDATQVDSLRAAMQGSRRCRELRSRGCRPYRAQCDSAVRCGEDLGALPANHPLEHHVGLRQRSRAGGRKRFAARRPGPLLRSQSDRGKSGVSLSPERHLPARLRVRSGKRAVERQVRPPPLGTSLGRSWGSR